MAREMWKALGWLADRFGRKETEEPTMEIAIVGDGNYERAVEILSGEKYHAAVVYWHKDERGTWGALRVLCRDQAAAEKLMNEVPGSDRSIEEFEGFPLLHYPVQLGFFVTFAEFPMGARFTEDEK